MVRSATRTTFSFCADLMRSTRPEITPNWTTRYQEASSMAAIGEGAGGTWQSWKGQNNQRTGETMALNPTRATSEGCKIN